MYWTALKSLKKAILFSVVKPALLTSSLIFKKNTLHIFFLIILQDFFKPSVALSPKQLAAKLKISCDVSSMYLVI